MMFVYLAIKRGVYRHEVLAASDNPETVSHVGREFIRREHDHHHDVEIVCLPLTSYQGVASIAESVLNRLTWLPDSGSPIDQTGPGKVVNWQPGMGHFPPQPKCRSI